MFNLRKKKVSLLITQAGFTLVELLVVFAIMSMLMASSVVSFSSFGRNQSFKTAVDEVANELQLARSRALSRVKPSQCGTTALRGYQVSLTGQLYRLRVVCNVSTTYIIESKNLPNSVFFGPGTVLVNFAVSTGTVNPSPVTISVVSNGVTKTITVTSSGVISIN